MSILVTGSTGTIGAQVLGALQGLGLEVRASHDRRRRPSCPRASCRSGAIWPIWTPSARRWTA